VAISTLHVATDVIDVTKLRNLGLPHQVEMHLPWRKARKSRASRSGRMRLKRVKVCSALRTGSAPSVGTSTGHAGALAMFATNPRSVTSKRELV